MRKNKMNKFKQFFLNIGKHLWAYALFCLAGSLLSIYIVDLINKPRNEETISILVASYDDKCETFRNEVNQRRPKYLREIQFNTYSLLDERFEDYYLKLAYGLSDIVILPESKVNESKVQDYYAIFNDEIKTKYFPNKEWYTLDDKDYGILIHKKDTEDNHLLTYCLNEQTDEDYYLFFYWKSKHIGSLNNTTYNTAFELMQVF